MSIQKNNFLRALGVLLLLIGVFFIWVGGDVIFRDKEVGSGVFILLIGLFPVALGVICLKGKSEVPTEDERVSVLDSSIPNFSGERLEPQNPISQEGFPSLIPPSIFSLLPALVRDEISSLSPRSQEAFVEEYRRKAKKSGYAYLLWFLGFHYAYMGKWGLFILFLITLGGMYIWWIIDLFRIGGIVRDFNKDVAVDVLRGLRSIQRPARVGG